jgi:hypothetical protein
MPQASVRLNELGASQVIPLDLRRYSNGVGLIVSILGVLNCSVQVTGDNIFAEGYRPILGNWNFHDTLFNLTASANGNLEYPVTGVRLAILEYTSGFANLSVVQAEG